MSVQNIDLDEIQKFSAFAQDWWDLTGPCAPLHHFNPLRLEFIKQYATLAQQSVLDIGCGGGILSESMAHAQANVTGIDMSTAALDAATNHAQQNNLPITYHLISAEQFAVQQPHTFDVVTCMELLEHVPDPASLVAACARLVKPGGYVFFSTINRCYQAYLLAVLGAEYVLHLLPRGTHDYQKFIRPSELAKWARASELNLRAMQGVRYNPFTQQCNTTKSVAVNYQCCFQLEH